MGTRIKPATTFFKSSSGISGPIGSHCVGASCYHGLKAAQGSPDDAAGGAERFGVKGSGLRAAPGRAARRQRLEGAGVETLQLASHVRVALRGQVASALRVAGRLRCLDPRRIPLTHAVLGHLACQAEAQRVARPSLAVAQPAGDTIPRPVSRLTVRWLPQRSARGVRALQRSRIAAERAFFEVGPAATPDGPRLPYGCREGRR